MIRNLTLSSIALVGIISISTGVAYPQILPLLPPTLSAPAEATAQLKENKTFSILVPQSEVQASLTSVAESSLDIAGEQSQASAIEVAAPTDEPTVVRSHDQLTKLRTSVTTGGILMPAQTSPVTITVTNEGETPIDEAYVVVRKPTHCQLVKTDKPLSQFEDRFEFLLTAIAPNSAKSIHLEVVPQTSQPLQWTVTVLPSLSQQITMSVHTPRLTIHPTPQKSALPHTELIQTLEIENANPIDLVNVQITATIPEGVDVTKLNRAATLDAQARTIRWTIDRLSSGQREMFQFMALPSEPGFLRFPVTVQAFGVAPQTLELTTVVAASSVPYLGSSADPIR